MSPQRLRIILDVDPTSEPIEGLISVQGAPDRDFSGWMGLTRALEMALRAAAEGSAEGRTSRPADGTSALTFGAGPDCDQEASE
ncbi:MAG: hypothetical protein WAM30_05560 [Candidatus Dormiibacterota bacterium]